ncbi:MAG: RluA family pseudouridine synthase [Phaeodactylibacter sp.]|nr:RluA family pseudouridine synthase [Phaeodactylibacter sp.]MCI4651141.1 RluA family pseudouridine synthase [Phaeodactylibacter sp.]MCI5090720.1 RluA family pseudouridine synthase [Phaeodactylibacter sp.]
MEKAMEDNTSDEYFEHKVIKADPKQSMIRIDKFLNDKLQHVSRSRVQDAIKLGSITVSGKQVKPNYKIKPGDEIEVVVPQHYAEKANFVKPQNIPLDIRYEDDDLLIVHKPAGMVVHPGVGNPDGTLVNALAYHFNFEELPVLEGNSHQQVGLVHRIDKDTSGLLVVAKTDYAMTHLARQFFEHTIDRRYVAMVWGGFEEEQGTIRGNVGRHPRFRQKHTVFPEGEAGKWAVTHYRVLEDLYYVSLVECKLETGRTHQIRVHMKHIGHPLFNDMKYGGDQIVKGTVFSKYKSFVENTFQVLPRQALHAKSLGFTHPATKERMYFESELPEEFEQALERWRTYLRDRQAKKQL